MNEQKEQGPGVTDTPEELTARFWGAYQQYLEALGEAVGSEDLQQGVAAAYQRYMEAQQSLWESEEIARPVAEAFQEYTRLLQEALAPAEVSRQATQAFRDYVLEVKKAWASLDADAVDASSMMGLSQSMAAVAWLDMGRSEALAAAPEGSGKREGPAQGDSPAG